MDGVLMGYLVEGVKDKSPMSWARKQYEELQAREKELRAQSQACSKGISRYRHSSRSSASRHPGGSSLVSDVAPIDQVAVCEAALCRLAVLKTMLSFDPETHLGVVHPKGEQFKARCRHIPDAEKRDTMFLSVALWSYVLACNVHTPSEHLLSQKRTLFNAFYVKCLDGTWSIPLVLEWHDSIPAGPIAPGALILV
jgi:hypothetical protein